MACSRLVLRMLIHGTEIQDNSSKRCLKRATIQSSETVLDSENDTGEEVDDHEDEEEVGVPTSSDDVDARVTEKQV